MLSSQQLSMNSLEWQCKSFLFVIHAEAISNQLLCAFASSEFSNNTSEFSDQKERDGLSLYFVSTTLFDDC